MKRYSGPYWCYSSTSRRTGLSGVLSLRAFRQYAAPPGRVGADRELALRRRPPLFGCQESSWDCLGCIRRARNNVHRHYRIPRRSWRHAVSCHFVEDITCRGFFVGEHPSTPPIPPSGSCSYRNDLFSMANPETLEEPGATVESRGDACRSSDWADWSGHPERALACSRVVAAGPFANRRIVLGLGGACFGDPAFCHC